MVREMPIASRCNGPQGRGPAQRLARVQGSGQEPFQVTPEKGKGLSKGVGLTELSITDRVRAA